MLSDKFFIFLLVQGSESVEAICLDYGIGSSEHVISGSKFGRMLGLRFLELADANLCGNSLRPWLRWLDWLGIMRVNMMELRWLGWHGTTGLNTLCQIYSKKLLILDLSASIVDETWEGWRLHLVSRFHFYHPLFYHRECYKICLSYFHANFLFIVGSCESKSS